MKKEKEDKIENSAMTLLKERAMVFSAFESGIFFITFRWLFKGIRTIRKIRIMKTIKMTKVIITISRIITTI